MSETSASSASESMGAEAEQVRTNDPTVDEVLSAVEALEERPLEEHVGVFEQAHQQLRRALDARPEASSE